MESEIRAGLALVHKPGAYVVLAGAGLSAASQVPQAWQVQEALIRQVAASASESPSDAFAWWRERYGQEATYEAVVGALADTPAERRALLEPFFEPDEQDRAEGRKVPSAAHRAIARLVAAGQVRVVLTTNFDLLVEAALREVGVEPVVVSTAAQLAGMEPLHARRALVVHLHGTYLDSELRNTADELGSYPPALDRLLDRVLDEYGLVVVGWSARWDTALREAVERCTARRYSAWWVDAYPLSQQAAALAARRDAEVVIADAGAWLGRLADVCDALDADRLLDPLSVTVAVRSAKREIAGGQPAITLHDAVRAEVERVRRLPVLDRAQSMNPLDVVTEHARRLAVLEAQVDVLLGLVACAAHWGSAATDRYWLDDIARFAEPPLLGGSTELIDLLRGPAVLVLYAAGVAATAAGREELLARLLADVLVPNPYQHGRFPAVAILSPNLIYPRARWSSQHLQDRLRPLLAGELGLGDAAYDDAWQRWQYLIGVVCQDRPSSERRWTGRPRLLVDGDHRGPLQVVTAPTVRLPIERAAGRHPLLRGGVCGGDVQRFTAAADAFEASYGAWAGELDWAAIGPQGGVLPSGPHWPGV